MFKQRNKGDLALSNCHLTVELFAGCLCYAPSLPRAQHFENAILADVAGVMNRADVSAHYNAAMQATCMPDGEPSIAAIQCPYVDIRSHYASDNVVKDYHADK